MTLHKRFLGRRSPRIKRILLLWVGLLLPASILFSGCMGTRGMMYLHPERSAVYLSKENKPSGKKSSVMVEGAVQKARDLLQTIPDGRRRLGGFCTEKDISKRLRKLMLSTPKCRQKLALFQNQSNTFGVVFWSLLGATAVTGLAGVIGGAAAPDGDTRATLMIVFGSISLVTALTNSIGPFSRIQDRNKALGMRLDNYMWTLRKRVSVEVCTAPDKATATHRLGKIEARVNKLCVSEKPDNGLYELPSK